MTRDEASEMLKIGPGERDLGSGKPKAFMPGWRLNGAA
jgi:hypothetical protein